MSSVTTTDGFDRQAAIRRLDATPKFDVVVVGGGVTGCGVALDSAARGLSTALVESGDFAEGTSSASSKLVHGGLRYLRQHDYRLVFESLTERHRLLHNAPHLVEPLPFLIPLFGRAETTGAMVAARGVAKAYSTALWAYDLAGGLRIGHRHRRIGTEEAATHVPSLRRDRLAGSFIYWDAQADDARLTLALARTAALGHGAVIVNHLPVVGLMSDASGKITGVRLADGRSIFAGVVVNAGGVWAGEVAALPGGARLGVATRPAKGVHISVAAHRLVCDHAVVLPADSDGRSIFVVPWQAALGADPGLADQYTYIGTTDTVHAGPLEGPHCTADDIGYLLRSVNKWTTASITTADITGTWAGLRPLVDQAGSGRTADLSRKHAIIVSANGMVTVTGGKLTTYRRMAADAVDEVFGVLNRKLVRSSTRSLVLHGGTENPGSPGATRWRATARGAASKLAGACSAAEPLDHRPVGLDADAIEHLRGRYGSELPSLLELCRLDPSLAERLDEQLPYRCVEVVFAVRHEMATTLADVLVRRTRALMLNARATRRAVPLTARLVAAELGWSEETVVEETTAMERLLDAEETVLSAPSPTPTSLTPTSLTPTSLTP